MSGRAATPALLSLALAAALAAEARADDSSLENWLRWVRPQIEREDTALLAWRRSHPDLTRKLLATAGDHAKPQVVRRGAILVLGVSADDAPTQEGLVALTKDPQVAEEAKAAAGRTGARLSALSTLRGLVPLVGAAQGSPRAERLKAAGKSLTAAEAREVMALMGDPLFDASSPGRPLRCVAARLLGWSGGDAATRALAETARDAFAGTAIRGACLLALSARGEDNQLATVLFELGDQPQDWDLLRAGFGLLEDRSPGFRAACKRLLTDGAAAPALQVALANDLAARHATNALVFLEPLARTRRGFDRSEHLELVVALARLDPASLEVHAPQILDYALASEEALAGAAVQALLELHPPRLGALLSEVLDRPDPGGELKVRAMQLIELLEVRETGGRVSELLVDEGVPWAARQAAAHAIGALGGLDGVRALAGALGGEERGGEAAALRREAADALGACPTRADSGRAALERALLDPEPTVRRAVLRALAAYADPLSRPAVTRVLSRPPTSERECQARLLTATRLEMFDAESARLLLGLPRLEGSLGTALAVVAYAKHLTADLAVPALLELLTHDLEPVGKAAVAELLRRYPPGRAFGYETPGATARRRAVSAWRDAWAKEPERFR